MILAITVADQIEMTDEPVTRQSLERCNPINEVLEAAGFPNIYNTNTFKQYDMLADESGNAELEPNPHYVYMERFKVASVAVAPVQCILRTSNNTATNVAIMLFGYTGAFLTFFNDPDIQRILHVR